jgi:hypothetical protein
LQTRIEINEWFPGFLVVEDKLGHRKKNLTDLLGVQAFEHVHALLNEMVATHPRSRIASTDLKERLENMTLLVEGNYAPLAPSSSAQMAARTTHTDFHVNLQYFSNEQIKFPATFAVISITGFTGSHPSTT